MQNECKDNVVVEITASSKGDENETAEKWKEKRTTHTPFVFRNVWVRFTPALIVWPIWLFLMCQEGGQWSQVFTDYYPATIAMALGSFVAGSTPLGGGVVAFPVAVLVLDLSSEESRDASVLVQSIGMTAASFLLVVCKKQTLIPHIIYPSIVFGSVGVLIGLSCDVSSYVVNLTFTVAVFMFMLVYMYTNILVLPASTAAAVDKKEKKEEQYESHLPEHKKTSEIPSKEREFLGNLCLALSALIGGFITSKVGSGSDMAVFVYGIYGWNNFFPNRRKSDVDFTASSVVIMAVMSVLTSLIRGIYSDFSERTMDCWAAMAFVVVIGAPIGSIVLKPSMIPYLRGLFYVMAVTQFAMFSVLKIGLDAISWIVIVLLLCVEVTVLGFHRHRSVKG